MKKKGFTLVELLAVIVILAIIALIATPIILNVVKETKKKAAIESFNGYMDAMEKTIAVDAIRSESKLPKADSNGCYNLKELNEQVKIKGNKPTIDDKDTACLEKGRIKSISEIIIDGYKLEYKDNKVLINGEVVSDKSYVGITSKDYTVGEKISYLGKYWLVMKDNGTSVKLLMDGYLSGDELKSNLPSDAGPYILYDYSMMMCHNDLSSSKYCTLSSGYTWKTSIVKPTIENWLNNKMKENGVTKENELVGMTFTDGVENNTGYIRLLMKDEVSVASPGNSGYSLCDDDGVYCPVTDTLIKNRNYIVPTLTKYNKETVISFGLAGDYSDGPSIFPLATTDHRGTVVPVITVNKTQA